MTRPAADVINAILANLIMAHGAADQRRNGSKDGHIRSVAAGECLAYSEAIALIRTEASDLLEAKP